MADNGKIRVVLDAAAVDQHASKTAREVLKIAQAAEQSEKAFAKLAGLVKKETGVATNALKELANIGRALSGSFSEAGLKINSLQGALKNIRAQSINVISEIERAKGRVAQNTIAAVREQQIQRFSKANNRGFQGDTDLESLRLRLEAERRRIAAAEVQGKTPTDKTLERERAIREQILRLEQQQADIRRQGTRDEQIRERIQKAELAQQAAVLRVEEQRARVRQAQLRVEQALNQTRDLGSTAVRNATQELIRQKSILEQVANQDKLRRARITEERAIINAQNAADTTRARTNLNGGADFLKLQLRIFANFRLISETLQGLASGFAFVREFEQNLMQFQAITNSTNTSMAGLEETFAGLSTTTRFTATQIAEAAVVMGQAGLSASQVDKAIRSVTRLAVATGTDLKTAVDITTSAMGIFNLRASEMTNVANIVAAALNETKLDAQKLSLGLQYAGNIAANSGVSFIELTTALSAMANAGVKSGSTLGTGFRQLIQDLISPSDKLKDAFDRLGITMGEVDIRTQGIFGVLKNLRDGGFNTADALETMELRGAAAFTNLIRQVDDIGALQVAIASTGDAAEANATQMDTLDSQLQRVTNAGQTAFAEFFKPFGFILKNLASLLADTLTYLRGFGEAIGIVVSAVGVAALGAFTAWIGSLAAGLVKTSQLTASLVTLATAFRGVTTAAGAASAAGAALSVLAGPLKFLALTLAAGVGIWALYGNSVDKAQDSLDKTKTLVDENDGALKASQDTVQNITEQLEKLALRYSSLKSDNSQLPGAIAEVNNAFKDMGVFIDQTTASVDDLIAALVKLRQEELERTRNGLSFKERTLSRQRDLQVEKASTFFNQNQFLDGNVGRFFRTETGNQVGADTLEGPITTGRDKTVTADLEEFKRRFGAQAEQVRDTLLAVSKLLAPENDPQGDENKIREFQSKVAEQVAQIRLLEDILREKGDRAGQDILNELVEKMRTAENAVTQVLTLNAKQAQTRRDLDVTNIERRLRTQVDNLVINLDKGISAIEEDFTKARDNDPKRRVTDESRKIRAENLGKLYKNFTDEYANLLRTLGDDEKKKFESSASSSAIKNALGKLRKRAVEAQIEALEIDEDVIKAEIKETRTKIQTLMATINNKTNISELVAIPEQINHLYDQLLALEKRQREIKEKQYDSSKKRTRDLETEASITERLETDRAGALTRTKEFLESLNLNVEDSNRKLSEVVKASDRFKENIKKINEALDQINYELELSQAIRKGRRAGLDNEFNGNRDAISDVQRRDIEKDNRRQDLIDRQAQIDATRATIPQYDAKILEAQKTYVENKQRILQLDALINLEQSKQNFDAEQLKKYEGERASLASENKRINEQVNDVRREQAKTIRDVTKAQAELNNETSKAQPYNLVNGSIAAFRQWQQEAGRSKDFTAAFVDNLGSIFDRMESGFSDAVEAMVLRTGKLKDAFRSMVTDILKSMLRIATNKLAASLFGFVFDAFLGGTVTGAQSAAAGGYGSSPLGEFGGTPIRRQGGEMFKRFRTGTSAPTRDSVKALLMPGEFVMQKSAVDAIGVDNMRRINTLGRRAFENVPTYQQAAPKEPDTVNVYVVAPDQKPQLGPKDIIATIDDNIARGGSTKQLIKQIQLGV